VETILTPFLDALARFRDEVRAAGIQKDMGKVLTACDKIRDEVLPPLGVRLDDTAEGSLWKLADKQELMKEMELKRKAEQARLLAKQEQARREQERLEKAKVPPSEMFRSQADKYSAFDDSGFPIHDHEGKELSKGTAKKLRKEYDAQVKAHNKYLESIKQQQPASS
jgi:cysteinyl-tRNA synthetase